jgi:hypothetical protein
MQRIQEEDVYGKRYNITNEFIVFLSVLRDLCRICTKSLEKVKGPCGPLTLGRLRDTYIGVINIYGSKSPVCTPNGG